MFVYSYVIGVPRIGWVRISHECFVFVMNYACYITCIFIAESMHMLEVSHDISSPPSLHKTADYMYRWCSGGIGVSVANPV